MCAVELEASAIFRADLAPDPQDAALYRSVIDGAMARLQKREIWAEKLRRRMDSLRLLRPAFGFAALGAAAAVAFLLFHSPSSQPTASAPALPPLILTDGSEVMPATVATQVQIEEQSPSRMAVRLRAGSAQFRVRHDDHRRFTVNAGTVEIEDVGTVFRVAHESAGAIRVAVSEGSVIVRDRAASSQVTLGAGENLVFSPHPNGVPAMAVPVAGSATQSAALAEVPEAPKEEPKLQAASSAGATPSATNRPRLSDDPASLLQAADLARRSHNPQAAVVSLRRLVEKYPKDPRTPSAAFTLGWVLLNELGRPRDAAAAFEEAERRASSGMLAEDASARVAEAWQRAGDSRRAAEAARRYEQLYPTGRHLSRMHALAGEH
jgi:transmembrane sensor